MAALPAAIAAVTESLYQRLGGAAGVAAIVDDAVDRHAANPVLAPRLRGKDLPQLKSLGVTFLVAGSGGPPLHETCAMPAMSAVQAGMRFSADEMDAVIADVAATMVEQGAGAAEVGEVIRLYRAHALRIQ
jgi:hemoglobin